MAFGQIEKKPEDFSKVTAFDRIDVMLIPGNENILQLDGKQADEVELINKNGELKMRMLLTKLLEGDNISVTVYFKNLTAVKANEGSRISCGDRIKSTFFDIIAKEGSQVKLILDVEKLNVRTANGSKVSLEGSAKNQGVLVNSGGIYEAKDLISNTIEIACNAGGEAEIFGTYRVEAKVRAGGNITVYGTPKIFGKKIVAGGTIEQAK